MRFAQLDSLRAVAIALVMFEHFAGQALNHYVPLGAGFLGVGCFFTLSGFLITSTLLYEFDHEPAGKGAAWWKFYARRVLRLMPAYYGWLLVLVLLKVEPVVSSWEWHVTYLSNIWIAMGNPILDFWSLAVEEQFYAIWPFVIALTPRRFLPHMMVATTIVLSLALKAVLDRLGVSHDAMQTLLFTKTPELGMGGLLALACYRNGRPGDFSWLTGTKARAFAIIAFFCLAVDVIGWAIYRAEGWFRFYFNDLLAGVFFTWLVARCAIGFTGPIGYAFSHPAPQYVGRISYGLYLVHNWTPELVERMFGPMPKLLAAPLVLGLTFGICALSWQFYEKPILGLKRFLSSAPKKGRGAEDPARPAIAEAAAAPISGTPAKAS